MKKQTNFHAQEGFTFLEVIIATALFSIIVALVAFFAVMYFRNYSFSFEEQLEIGQAQSTMTRTIREIRKAQMGEDGSWPLVQTDDNSFTFYADVTGDTRTDKVRYFLSGTTLKRGVIQPTLVPVTYPAQNESLTTVVTNINATSSAIFKYYNGNWPADLINNPLIPSQRILNTRFVQVTIRLNPTPNFAAQPFEVTSGVSIRSIKDNL